MIVFFCCQKERKIYMEKNELVVKEENNFVIPSGQLEIDTEDLDGLTITFDKISIPSGGGQMWELPGADNPDEPDFSKEIEGVIRNDGKRRKRDVYSSTPRFGHFKRNNNSGTGNVTQPSDSATNGSIFSGTGRNGNKNKQSNSAEIFGEDGGRTSDGYRGIKSVNNDDSSAGPRFAFADDDGEAEYESSMSDTYKRNVRDIDELVDMSGNVSDTSKIPTKRKLANTKPKVLSSLELVNRQIEACREMMQDITSPAFDEARARLEELYKERDKLTSVNYKSELLEELRTSLDGADLKRHISFIVENADEICKASKG